MPVFGLSWNGRLAVKSRGRVGFNQAGCPICRQHPGWTGLRPFARCFNYASVGVGGDVTCVETRFRAAGEITPTATSVGQQTTRVRRPVGWLQLIELRLQ